MVLRPAIFVLGSSVFDFQVVLEIFFIESYSAKKDTQFCLHRLLVERLQYAVLIWIKGF